MNKIIILSLFLFGIVTCVFAYEEDWDESTFDTEWLEVVSVTNETPKIMSKTALVYDNTYNKILYEKNMYEKIPNASTTKILTAIVAYENSNPEDVVIVGKKAAIIGRLSSWVKIWR